MTRKTILSLMLSTVLLTGCNGGEQSSKPVNKPSGENSEPVIIEENQVAKAISGIALDGYLKNAKVCLDINRNLVCDDGDGEHVFTDSEGRYLLTHNEDSLTSYDVLVEVIPGKTIDMDDPDSTIDNGFILMSAAKNSAIISPVSTIIHSLALQGNISFTDATEQLSNILDIPSSQLTKDYIGSDLQQNKQLHSFAKGLTYILQEAEKSSKDDGLNILNIRKGIVAKLTTVELSSLKKETDNHIDDLNELSAALKNNLTKFVDGLKVSKEDVKNGELEIHYPAPTGGVVDDTADTFDWEWVGSFTAPRFYEISTDAGETWKGVTEKPFKVGDNKYKVGDLRVRLKTTKRHVTKLSGELENNAPYTLKSNVEDEIKTATIVTLPPVSGDKVEEIATLPVESTEFETVEKLPTATVEQPNIAVKEQNPAVEPPAPAELVSVDALASDTLETKGSHGFKFAWNPASRATQYQVFIKVSDQPYKFQSVSSILPANSVCSSDVCTIDIPAGLSDYMTESSTYQIRAYNEAGDSISNEVDVGKATKLAAAAYLKSPNLREDDQFGSVIAISADGQTLAVGAPNDGGERYGFPKAGAVYIFTRQGAIWRLQDHVTHLEDSHHMGTSVSLSADGKTLAVGKPGAYGLKKGAAFIYSFDHNKLKKVGQFTPAGTTSYDLFGKVVSLSADGKTLAVGSKKNGKGKSVDGAVYIYNHKNGEWSQTAELKSPNSEPKSNGDVVHSVVHSTAVVLSGDGKTLAVGSPYEEEANSMTKESGAVYVYALKGLSWEKQAHLKADFLSHNGHFGHALSINKDGNTLAIGVPGDDIAAPGDDAGAVFIFTREETIWRQQSYLHSADNGGTHFGSSVSFSSDASSLAVSSLYDGGGAYLFTRNGDEDTWNQKVKFKPSSDLAFDNLGSAVVLSGDGNTLVVAADEESGDENSTLINRNENSESAGAVYIY